MSLTADVVVTVIKFSSCHFFRKNNNQKNKKNRTHLLPHFHWRVSEAVGEVFPPALTPWWEQLIVCFTTCGPQPGEDCSPTAAEWRTVTDGSTCLRAGDISVCVKFILIKRGSFEFSSWSRHKGRVHEACEEPWRSGTRRCEWLSACRCVGEKQNSFPTAKWASRWWKETSNTPGDKKNPPVTAAADFVVDGPEIEFVHQPRSPAMSQRVTSFLLYLQQTHRHPAHFADPIMAKTKPLNCLVQLRSHFIWHTQSYSAAGTSSLIC